MLPRLSNRFLLDVICYLYVLLFVYASVSKLLDYENFQVQIAQSPILSAYAGYVAPGVILVELLISGLLVVRKTTLMGLYLSVGLMMAFTVYIYLILNYSEFVPCSCGGILEELGWTEHLIFNLVFIGLGFFAIWLFSKKTQVKKMAIILKVFAVVFCSSGTVIFLFLSSEHIIKKENPFVRRFIPHLVEYETKMDLNSSRYYFAGLADSVLYLGDYLFPLNVLELNQKLEKFRQIKLEPEESKFNFRAVQVRVMSPKFYLFDGTVPCIYVGEIENKKAELKVENEPYFTIAEPIDTNAFVFRSNVPETGRNILGTLDLGSQMGFSLAENLLISQNENDGIFDTDGFLIVDNYHKNFVYTYRYKNQFLVVNQDGGLIKQGNTIDTISLAKIKIKKTSRGLEMSAPPLAVNLTGAVYKNHLFIHSALRGKYDDKKSWDLSATIDVYDLNKGIYLFSFYLTGLNDKKLSQFVVNQDKLYALFGSQIMMYSFGGLLKESLKSD